MNRTFVIGDTHFGHKKITEFSLKRNVFNSIKEHDDFLVDRWNNAVNKRDTVWVLGDVCFGVTAFDNLGRLHGVKRLVMGNHDQYPVARYLQYFNSIHGCAEVRNCILTHIPVHESQFHRYRANVHGHLHDNKINDPRYICVSAEHTDLQPVLLDNLLTQPREKKHE